MVASNKTVVDVYLVLQEHVPNVAKRSKLLADLANVPGNKSFTQTVKLLQELHDSLVRSEETQP